MAAVSEDKESTTNVDAAEKEKSDVQSSNAKKKENKKGDIHVPKSKKLGIESVSVREAMVTDGVVYYDIHVRTRQYTWIVQKRYRQFEELHSSLHQQFANRKLPLLPAKHYKIFTDHSESGFIEQRRALLDNYVKKVIKMKEVGSSQSVVNFFHNDKAAQLEDHTTSNTNHPTSAAKANDNNNSKQDNNDTNDDSNRSNNNKSDNNTNKDNNNDDHKSNYRDSNDSTDYPNDQEVTKLMIQSVRKMSDHVLYQIQVVNDHKRESFGSWTVLKRFTQFYEMDTKLREDFAADEEMLKQLPPPPPRRAKIIYDHMDDDFIEERRVLLENYLSKLLKFPEVARNNHFLEFLGVEV